MGQLTAEQEQWLQTPAGQAAFRINMLSLEKDDPEDEFGMNVQAAKELALMRRQEYSGIPFETNTDQPIQASNPQQPLGAGPVLRGGSQPTPRNPNNPVRFSMGTDPQGRPQDMEFGKKGGVIKDSGWTENPQGTSRLNMGKMYAPIGGAFGGLLRGAKNLFEDPTRMALLSGGLSAMDPNSYYDKQGFYSPWTGLQAGLGTGIRTYKKLGEPRKLGFKEQEKIKHDFKMEQIRKEASSGKGMGEYRRLMQEYFSLDDADPRKAMLKRRIDKMGMKEDSGTAMFKNFEEARKGGYEGTFYDYQVDLKRAGKTEVNVYGEQQMTKGREASDKVVGKMYAEYIARGGYGDALKNLSQLKVAHERLLAVSDGTSGDNLTGPLLGMVPDFIRSFYNPESIDTRELVEEVVQRNLRLILGAQFTEREGERLIARAYNPKLDEASNAKRLGRLVKAMEIAMEARNDSFTYFEENGTLLGWKGETPTMDDFMRAVGDAPTPIKEELIPEGFEVVE